MKHTFGALPVLILVIGSLAAQGANISKMEPLAVRPGTSTKITLEGEGLEGATKIWTSFPGYEIDVKLADGSTNPARIDCILTLHKGVPLGVGVLQVATTNGAVPFRLFSIDDLSTAIETLTNHTVARAQKVSLPVAIDGQTDELQFDFFRFNARKGQRITAEVVAQRIGSRLDPVIRILDMQGKEVSYCDDDPRVGRDARVAVRIPASGEYVIEVRDINYNGGAEYHYRLRLGAFQLPTMAFPPFAQPEKQGVVTILAAHSNKSERVRFTMPSNAPRFFVLTKARRGESAASATILHSHRAQPVEIEPNNDTNAATRLDVPGAINARFENENDVDIYRFTAEKDEKLVVRGRTRSLGSPCDLFMLIRDVKGKTVAEFDPTGADEGTITNQFKDAGDYVLVVEELTRSGGFDLAYHLEIERYEAGFDLILDANLVNLAPGASAEIKVTVARRDYDGPLELNVEGSSDVTAEKTSIPEKKNEVQLKIKVAEHVEEGSLHHVRILGRAMVGPREYVAVAGTMPALRKLWPGLNQPPRELEGIVTIGIRGAGAKPEVARKSDDE